MVCESYLIPDHSVHATGERTYTFYPGRCPNDQRWYFIDADDTSVTVGCLDPDYDESQPEN